ncbi:MFS transporter [Aureibacillus halotolerans]|uniref:MFS transporter n=1 Tax=Aureibacillus halotolerans TaxID=1508390 RepID=A0A4R6TQA7_9BACI|nr:MFS transporter [Aureibacillus halotolerans]TDQ33779.1 MFS transporter [Aureibacillus halotolerans]
MRVAYGYFKEVFKEKMNRQIIVGALSSRIGTLAFTAALSLYVLKLTGSPSALGFTLLMGTLPYFILGMVTGVVCDRFDKKKIIVVSDIARVIIGVMFILGLFILDPAYQLYMIYAVVILFAVFEAFLVTSFTSILPEVIPKEKLVDLNSSLSGLGEIARLLGPVLGTILFSFFGIHVVAMFIVLCFGFSVLYEMGIPYKMKKDDSGLTGLGRIVKSELAGFRDLFTLDLRVTSLFVNGFTTHLFLLPFLFIGIPYILNSVLGGHPTEYGVVEMFASIGGLLSVLFVPYLRMYGIAKNLLFGMIGMIMGTLFFSFLLFDPILMMLEAHLLPRVLFFSTCMFIIYLCFGYYGVYFSSFLQQNIRSSHMSKGMSTVMMSNSLGRMLGFSLFGFLFNHSIQAAILTLIGGMILKVVIHIPFLVVDKAKRVESESSMI